MNQRTPSEERPLLEAIEESPAPRRQLHQRLLEPLFSALERLLCLRRPSKNLFLEGNFRPQAKQWRASALTVEGALPADLEGEFLRVGPNPRFMPRGAYHLFDGDGMIHQLSLSGGERTTTPANCN